MEVWDERFESKPKTNTIPIIMNKQSISANQNIQRCSIYRRISSLENIPISQLTDRKSKTILRNIQSMTHTFSSSMQPLRAFHMSTMITNELGKKTLFNCRHLNHLTIEKRFASRTIITTVLPSKK